MQRSIRSRVRVPGWLSSCAAITLFGAAAAGMWAMPEDVPVARLIENVGKFTKEHPADAQGFAVLARVHGLAFTLKSRTVSAWPGRATPEGLPQITDDSFQSAGWRQNSATGADVPPTLEELIAHLEASVRNYERAIALDPTPAAYHLGYAFVLETGADHAAAVEFLPELFRPQAASAALARRVVKPGETIFAICKEAYGDGGQWTWEKLRKFNPKEIGPKGEIRAGATLLLPTKDALMSGTFLPGVAGGGEPVKCADAPDPKLVELVVLLGDASGRERERARRELMSRLDEAAPLLHARRDDPNADVRAAARELVAAYWRDRAIEHYHAAFLATIDEDLKETSQPMRGLRTMISYESGRAYIRLLKARGPRNEGETTQLASAETSITTLEKLPPSGMITPIIFSLDGPAPLDSLLDPAKQVCFDLDGDGVAEPRPWVRPDTAILAWDPRGTGRIESGRQLFGSVSWWMFFDDGYRALDALDDDRDGHLTRAELDGIVVWFDRDQSGTSEPGEVWPVRMVGIESIATAALSSDGESPSNPIGLTLRDGRVLPTYDWIAHPWEETPPRPGVD